MTKKILFFTPSLAGGGSERTIVQLVNGLSAYEDLKISIVVSDLSDNKSVLLPLVSKKVNVINLACGRVSKSIVPLAKILRESDYDILISTQTHTNVASIVSKKIAKSTIQVILREVSTPSLNIQAKGLKLKIHKAIVGRLYRDAYKIVCVSNGVLNDFKNFYKYNHENLLTIYNPVLDGDYHKLLAQSAEHRFFENNSKVIIAIGRLTEAKNFPLLIKAFKKLYDKHPECRLIILGEGELRPKLQNIINELGLNLVVDLHGFTINPYAFFKYCDLFVLSSNWEGLPGVLIQALAAKIKIVSTDCPSGPLEILKGSKYGLLVEKNNPEAMAEAMRSAIFGSYIKFDLADLNEHCKQFEIDNVINKYLEIIT